MSNETDIVRDYKDIREDYAYQADIFDDEPERTARVKCIIEHLPPSDRILITMYADCQSLRKLASRLGLSHTTLRGEIVRIRQTINEQYQQIQENEHLHRATSSDAGRGLHRGPLGLAGHPAGLGLEADGPLQPAARQEPAASDLQPLHDMVGLPAVGGPETQPDDGHPGIIGGLRFFFKYIYSSLYIYQRSGPLAAQKNGRDMERLTPYLHKQCLALPLADRLALVRILMRTIMAEPAGKDATRLDTIAQAVESLAGASVHEPRHIPAAVCARSVFAFVAEREGFRQTEIGRYMGRDHSSVHFMISRMAQALDHPEQWNDYITLYNNTLSAIL